MQRRDRGTGGDAGAGFVWEEHPVYGRVRCEVVGATALISAYDLDFRPDLPPGALRGNPRRQTDFCPHCRAPKYFYLDQELSCRRCGARFVWPAEQQRRWFEELGLSAAARPPGHCPRCRRRQRTARAAHQRLDRAVVAAREQPDDPAALVELAAATVAHVRLVGSGNLDRALAAVRRAGRADPSTGDAVREAVFWEGACHDVAGRAARAVGCYERFVRAARPDLRLRGLVAEAERRLGELVLHGERTPPRSAHPTTSHRDAAPPARCRHAPDS